MLPRTRQAHCRALRYFHGHTIHNGFRSIYSSYIYDVLFFLNKLCTQLKNQVAVQLKNRVYFTHRGTLTSLVMAVIGNNYFFTCIIFFHHYYDLESVQFNIYIYIYIGTYLRRIPQLIYAPPNQSILGTGYIKKRIKNTMASISSSLKPHLELFLRWFCETCISLDYMSR